jgi:serine/threonine protein kinase/DNA-binding winged helix-turn-helix (wHTH) protein/tetratricopeptide (TPR) repeat protein
MRDTQPVRVRFGVFELDLKSGELRNGDDRTVLQEQPLQVLRMLIERESGLVTREDIRKKLWPNDTIVEFDHSINAAIRNLRKALGDSADEPKYIETLARRGYRLMMPAERISTGDSSSDVIVPALSPKADDAVGLAASADGTAARMQLQPASLAGRTVSHYRVLGVIGGGGMGVIYRAEDLKLGRAVALKFLPFEVGDDSHALQRFLREARTASSLNHPNICTIYEIEEYEGQPFIVMELLEGQTLRDRLAAPDALPLAQLLDLAVQMADGLQAAHEKGIIHRDIKPANIFVTNKNVAKILDFGVAKATELDQPVETAAGRAAPADHRSPAAPLTRAGLKVGTAGYMSPEQVRGQPLDARTDLFSFGLVLYEMVTRQRAFSGMSAASVEEAIVNRDPAPVRDCNATVPPELEAIIGKALQKDRAQRFQSAAEIKDSLWRLQHASAPGVASPQLPAHGASAHPGVTPTAVPKPQPAPGVGPARGWGRWAGLALLVLLCAGAGLWYWRWQHTRKLTAKDTIVIADFTNSTGDPVLDNTLREALAIQLEQSPFLNVLSDSRVTETLKLMNRRGNERLTREVAQEVCQRTNSKALLAGSISAIGDHYEIGLRALDCLSGNTLASTQAEAENRNQVLKTLQQAGNELREKLGESLASVTKFNVPLAQATTSSLEALQAFTDSRRLTSGGGGIDAIPYLRHAVQLDPVFAMAHVRLGIVYTNLNQPGLAVESFTKAFELRGRVSERERLAIESYYYFLANGELQKAIEACTQLVQTYPDDYDAHAALTAVYAELGQYDRALVEAKERVRLAPGYEPDANLVGIYINLGQFNEAQTAFERALTHKDHSYLRETGYMLAFLRGDESAMQRTLAWGMGKPGVEDWVLSAQSDTEAYHGRLHRAREFSLRAAESARQAGSPETAATWRANEAMREAEMGNLERAREVGAHSLTPDAGPDTEVRAALALARAGEAAQAQKLADKLNREFPLDTRVQYYSLPAIAAAIELQRNSPSKAIDILQKTVPYELGGPTAGITMLAGLYPAYLRGEAYLQSGQGLLAAAEFRKLTEQPGIVGNFITGPLARLQLARAQEMTGDTAAARKSYQDFLALWKDADPDIPIYKQAKAEYAKLR